MLKAIPYVIKLHVCKHVDPRVNHVTHFCQSNACSQKITYTQVQERDPCKQPDPCPPPPRDKRAFWGALAILFTAGCFGVYAKRTNEVRDWLTINAPWYDDLIAIAYQENKTYSEHAKDLIEAVRDYLTAPEPPRLCTSDGTPIKQPPKVKEKAPLDIICPKKPEEPSDPKKCADVTKPTSLKTICEIEKCLLNQGENCINNYWTAREACRYYNELVEDHLTYFTYERLKAIRPAMLERFRLLNEHVSAAAKALNTLEELTRLLDCGLSAPKEALANTHSLLKEFMAKIKIIQTEYMWEADRAVSLDKKWQKVEKLIDQYVAENQIMSGTQYNSEKPSINGDTDLLLIHTLRYKNMLENVLKEGVEAASLRANRCIETLSQDEKDVKARNYLIQSEFRKRQAQLDQSYKKKLDGQKSEVDKALQKSLKEIKDRQDKNLIIKLKEKEEEATKKLNILVKHAVDGPKGKFSHELNDLSLKVKAVEAKLEACRFQMRTKLRLYGASSFLATLNPGAWQLFSARLKGEREVKRSQLLFTAGASLLAATQRGEPHICVAKEIKAIESAAGDGDKLVLTLLKSIPEKVRKEGVVPESVLRERYHLMERTARSVALVELEGSPMPVYIISWVQSLLLFMRPSGIPEKDIEKPFKEDKELEDLDTFDRLNYARYWVEQGSLAPALRYVNSLQGASRVAADTWYKDAKIHLEIRQLAEAVIAHAKAMALQYV